jgi:hypothetical protein
MQNNQKSSEQKKVDQLFKEMRSGQTNRVLTAEEIALLFKHDNQLQRFTRRQK